MTKIIHRLQSQNKKSCVIL